MTYHKVQTHPVLEGSLSIPEASSEGTFVFLLTSMKFPCVHSLLTSPSLLLSSVFLCWPFVCWWLHPCFIFCLIPFSLCIFS